MSDIKLNVLTWHFATEKVELCLLIILNRMDPLDCILG